VPDPGRLDTFLWAAAALSLERIFYIWVCWSPHSVAAIAARLPPAVRAEPADLVRFLFYGFKILQIAVFVRWCVVFGGGDLRPQAGMAAGIIGALLIAAGQTLNLGVFYRLGNTGVFYGRKFGRAVPWREEFPFTLFAHPQFVGVVLTIWGFFAIMRFPNPDWYTLPALETAYYILAARYER